MLDNGNARKAFCIHGHPLSGSNLHVRPNGQRRCKTCQNRLRTESKLRIRAKGRPKEVSRVRISSVSDREILSALRSLSSGGISRDVAVRLGMNGVAASKAVYRRLTVLENRRMVCRDREKSAVKSVHWMPLPATPAQDGEAGE